jgi:hypothetical protein
MLGIMVRRLKAANEALAHIGTYNKKPPTPAAYHEASELQTSQQTRIAQEEKAKAARRRETGPEPENNPPR